jgi:dipeptidyl aminopeptidase/acylaminoacyl peptidase
MKLYLIRKELANFENLYDVEKYSLDNYLDKIKATIQIHQGTKDELVPQRWSDALVNKLEKLDIDVDYYTYSGADHNLKPSWNNVVNRDLTFFEKHISVE